MAKKTRPQPLDIARSQIEEANLFGQDQEQLRHDMLAFIAANHDALHRSCRPGHLTASAAIVDAGTQRTLLIHHAKLEKWLQPGGHADGDGDLGMVALKEAQEETGLTDLQLITPAIDLDIHTIPERGNDPTHLHYDVRFLVLTQGEPAPAHNHEATDARWMRPHDATISANSDLHRLISRAALVARAVRL